MNHLSSKKKTVTSNEYTEEYYQTACDGFNDFAIHKGQVTPLRLSYPITLANLVPPMRVVDIGCGRGEVIYQCVNKGLHCWGLDYSSSAVDIAKNFLGEAINEELKPCYMIQQGSALNLPYTSSSIDRIFMLDIVEHLTPDELDLAMQEAFRILKPNGRIIIHTMPSLWYYSYGYPIFRFVKYLLGTRLPIDPRDRCEYSFMHVNEQTPISLRRVLKNAGFKSHVWLESTQNYEHEQGFLVRLSMKFLVKVFPLKVIFCNDIYGIGVKPSS